MSIVIPDSKYNKNINLVNFLVQPILIVDGLVESGPILTHIWKTGVSGLVPKHFVPKKILLLGLGGGSNAMYMHKKFPKAEIDAVEIDSQMIDIANKYFKLNKKVPNIRTIVADALPFIYNLQSTTYDLTLVDCFEGKYIPKKLENLDFIQKIKDHSRYTLINRIWYKEHHQDTITFLKSLSSKFTFEIVHTGTNIVISLL